MKNNNQISRRPTMDDLRPTSFVADDLIWGSLIVLAFVASLISCQSRRPPATAQRSQLERAIVDKADREDKSPVHLTPVHFATASDRVLNSDYKALDSNAEWLKDKPDAALLIEGHCDERGSDEFNIHLGDKRARRVKYHLVEKGLMNRTFLVVSLGKKAPKDARHTPQAWRENRRVEFIVR